jgi:hypothetical protein
MAYITNIDTFIYTLDIKNYEKSAENTIKRLIEAKQNSKYNEVKDIIELHKKDNDLSFVMTFDVYPNGAQFHSFILSNDSYNIKIAEFRSKNMENYPIMIRLSSEVLWSLGLKKAINQINEIITTNFGEIKASKISRADFCCHTDEFDFQNFQLDYFIGRYREDCLYRQDRRNKAMYFGSTQAESHFCRIYDKSLEIKTRKSKTWFQHVWQEHDLNIDSVWNIEFELKRKFFKTRNIETLEDFFKKMNDIWHYLMLEWMRLNIKDHSYLDQYYDEWLKIGNSKFNEHNYSGLCRFIMKDTAADQMIPQILGVITSFSARKNKLNIDESIEDILKISKSYLRQSKHMTIDQLIEDKINRIVTG